MTLVHSPDDPTLDELCEKLAALAPELEAADAWPREQLDLCAGAGVFQWFMSTPWGGQQWSEADLLRGYVKLAAACLTTTFVITQRMGAANRIAASDNDSVQQTLLPNLLTGCSFATVGISHLTTSRQHLARPVLQAEETTAGFVLDGYSPWVTGAEFAQHIVLGATLADRRQVLVAMPVDLKGVRIERAPQLVGLSASRTGPVHLDRVLVERRWLLAGPVPEVMKQGAGARTGGLQTSALAIGLATAAIGYLRSQSHKRSDLTDPADSLEAERNELENAMLALASGIAVCTSDELRRRANSLALRSSQAALAAAKGAGYVAGHPAGRWCREALFFLVWSCPQPVVAANLCELAGLNE
ncbi:MAG: acyl-CoA/acyl-ACP dehydrogenase [Planctomycetaceae bacterium]|nr:acyl-CoA/acyl-ACP dehydrogenase [Planctomycetaceae bacterium]